ncbi:hypothetical protein [Pedobacter immunditicola]|uniref:hypothetical protein n=1 Tax=Pedobacter immunditicola TaxID=3133440 RepID=UPI0030ADEB07
MKVQFKRNTKLTGNTYSKIDIVGRTLANNISEGLSPEVYITSVFEVAEYNSKLDRAVLSPLNTDEIEDVTLDTKPVNTNGMSVYAPRENHYSYTLNYKPVSITYDCLFIYPDDVFILIEPETNKIIEYKKPKDAEAFLIH